MKKVVGFIIILIVSSVLFGCKGKSTVSEKKFQDALNFMSNKYYQIHLIENSKYLDGSVYTDDYTIKIDNDKLYIKENDDYGEILHVNYNEGKINGCYSYSGFGDLYLEEEISDYFEDYLGVYQTYSFYTWKELIQVFFWEWLDSSLYTFLTGDELQELFKKMERMTDWEKFELNVLYQGCLNTSPLFKAYNQLEYDKESRVYKYADKYCDINYHFEKSKIKKIEYYSADNSKQVLLEISYEKEKLSTPTSYNLANPSYNYIEVSLGERRNISGDLGSFHVDFSKARFLISDPDFATINEKTYTLIVSDFTKSISATLAVIVDDNVYLIHYILKLK